jgi:hypothetical protein
VKASITAVLPTLLLVTASFINQVAAQEPSQQTQIAQDMNNGPAGIAAPAQSADSSTAQQQIVSQPDSATDGVGPDIKGSSGAGSRPMIRSGRANPTNCVGPVSFCNVYFGG